MLLGLLVFSWGAAHSGPDINQHLPELATFFVIILMTELLPITSASSNIDVTVTVPAIISLFLSHGPHSALIVAPISIFIGVIVVHRRMDARLLLNMSSYNTALCTLAIGTAFAVYLLAGGRTLDQDPHVTVGSMILPLFLAVTASTTANVLLFATGTAIYHRDPWRLSVAQVVRWFMPNYIFTAPSGILFAYLYQQFGIYGVILIIVPFILGRQALNVYSRQTDTYRETITTLGTYMQHYHPYTRGHLERVADLSDRIARHMALPFRSLMFIREAGLLHDIGKVGVDEEILDKTGQLSPEDWAIIKEHPARGAEILARMKYLERIVPWVRGHHERPDGRGYPDGLAGDGIALEAAVIAVADAFDAMTGGPDESDRRVYRTPLTTDQGIDQVRYGAGTQFDHRVVKAFMRVMALEETTNGS